MKMMTENNVNSNPNDDDELKNIVHSSPNEDEELTIVNNSPNEDEELKTLYIAAQMKMKSS